jgi:hypothetical protein
LWILKTKTLNLDKMNLEEQNSNEPQKPQLNIGAVISWVAASEKLPSVEQNGNKVLIYRIMNDSQKSLAISIHETSMVKYCNVDETWWMELPKPPCL